MTNTIITSPRNILKIGGPNTDCKTDTLNDLFDYANNNPNTNNLVLFDDIQLFAIMFSNLDVSNGAVKLSTEFTIKCPNGSVVRCYHRDRILSDSIFMDLIGELDNIAFMYQEDDWSRVCWWFSFLKDNHKTKSLFVSNGTSIDHWLYKAFYQKVNPETGKAWRRPDDWTYTILKPKEWVYDFQ